MPNCFQLTAKAAPHEGPCKFNEIDDAMCKHFGAEPHPEEYYLHWYDFVGLRLALGYSWSEIAQENAELVEQYRTNYPKQRYCLENLERRAEVIEWLRQNFIAEAWYEPH